jgi:hypothetical protein
MEAELTEFDANDVDAIVEYNNYDDLETSQRLIEKRRCSGEDCGIASYWRDLKGVFGARFLVLLFLVQFAIKGVVYQIVRRGMFPLLKTLNVEAALVQLYLNVAISPWALKPMMGILSDLIVIGGRSKKYWLLFSSVIGMIGALTLTVDNGTSSSVVVLGMYALSFLGSFSDLLIQAKYSELLREHPQSGSRVVVFSNGAQQMGYGVACGLIIMFGTLVYWPVFLVVLGCAASIFLPSVLDFLPERCWSFDATVGHRGHRTCFFLVQKFWKDWKSIALIGLLGILSQVTVALPLLMKGRQGLIVTTILFYSLVAILLFLARLVFHHQSRWIGLVAIYEVLRRLMRPRLDSALDFFYTASPTCVPGGPQLSQFLYITVGCWMGVLATLIGLVLYQGMFKRWSFRSIALLTVALDAIASFAEFGIIQRWNVGRFPDSFSYLVAVGLLQPFTNVLVSLPGSVLMAKVCPKGLESSVFAFLAGMSNLAFGGAQLSGALAMELFDIHSTPGDCNFAALPWLILSCHTLLPILIGIPICFLLPTQRQDEALISGQEDS